MKQQRVEVWMKDAAPGESLEAFLIGGPVNGETLGRVGLGARFASPCGPAGAG